MDTQSRTVIQVSDLKKSFRSVAALKGVSMTVRAGEMVALIGASGSGKSTLLRQLGGSHTADPQSNSHVSVLGTTIQQGGKLAPGIRSTRADIAMIFQQFNLVDRLPVMTNVLAGALHRLPLWRGLVKSFPREEIQRAFDALSHVGIAGCAWQRASTLSGGQQQRAAISRAMVQGARILLADEPIASLDPESSRMVMDLLQQINRERGVTVLVSLHQIDFAFSHCPRTIALRGGVVVYDGPTNLLTNTLLRELYGSKTDELFKGSSQRLPNEIRPELKATLPSLHVA